MNDPIPAHGTVAVFGLGASGVGAAQLLNALGKQVVASDDRTALTPGLPDEVEVRLGGLDPGEATAVVLSPSLNPEWPENKEKAALAPLWERWRAGEIAVWSEVELAMAAFDGAVLTVGGTDGKSTTAAMATALLRASGHRTLLGGNSWTALSTVVSDEGADATHAVVEVSAFQLWEPHRMRPSVSILTNIAPDHLDHYAADEDYVAAKLHIHRNLGADTAAVLHAGDARLAAAGRGLRESGVPTLGYSIDPPGADSGWHGRAWVDGRSLEVEDAAGSLEVPIECLRVPGSHNRKNALAALLGVRRLLGSESASLTAETAQRGLGGFTGLPHRLEFVRELDTVRYFDDSKATNVHAAVAGIRSMDRPLVAIVGGVDKRLDLGPFIDALADHARAVVVIGELRPRFLEESRGRIRVVREADDLEGAVSLARAESWPGDAVVLSPGCSSFDMFRSFEHRGRAFADAVDAL